VTSNSKHDLRSLMQEGTVPNSHSFCLKLHQIDLPKQYCSKHLLKSNLIVFNTANTCGI